MQVIESDVFSKRASTTRQVSVRFIYDFNYFKLYGEEECF